MDPTPSEDREARELAAWNRRIARRPRDARLYLGRARFHAAAGRPGEAVKDLSETLRLDPGLLDAYIERARHYQALDMHEEVLADVRSVLKSRRRSDAVELAAAAHEKLGRLDEAIALYRELIRMRPEHAKGRYALSFLLYQSGRIRRAIRHIRAAMRLAPAEKFYEYMLADYLAVLKEREAPAVEKELDRSLAEEIAREARIRKDLEEGLEEKER